MTILDNYLSEIHFKQLQNSIIGNFNLLWNHSTNIASHDETVQESYFTHTIYDNYRSYSPLWDTVKHIVIKFPDFRTILRAKINLYPKQHKIVEHPQHVDQDFPAKGAILYLNTCDGFTRIDENTIVESVENRLLLFNSSKPHNSTSTTTPPGRFNININYL